MVITSKDNETIKKIKKLKDKKYRDQENCYIIEGIKLIKEAIEEKVLINNEIVRINNIYNESLLIDNGKENKTKEESTDPQTDTISITMSPRSTDKAIKAVIEPSEQNQAVYDTFFKKVYEKDATAEV